MRVGSYSPLAVVAFASLIGAAPCGCGGKQGLTCSSDEWCDYGNDLCGNADDIGVCTPKPLDCAGDEPDPTCACDGTVYPSECMANLAGYDVYNSGGCPAPRRTFICGKTFCVTGQQYCVRSVSDVGGTPDSSVSEVGGYSQARMEPNPASPSRRIVTCRRGSRSRRSARTW